MQSGKGDVHFLIVYLHDSSSQPATELFLQTFLLTEQLRDMLVTSNSLIWGASVKSDEGHNVARRLRVLKYPFIGLFSCVPNDGFECILRHSEVSNSDDLFATLEAVMDIQQPYMQSLVMQRLQRDNDRQILREQEDEYARSLAADQARLRERQRLVSETEEQEKKAQLEVQNRERRKTRFDEMRLKIRSTLPDEASAESSVRLKIHFPDGSSFNRNFHPSDTLEMLFNVVMSNDQCPVDFSLLTGHPAKLLPCTPKWYRDEFSSDAANGNDDAVQTFADVGLHSGSGHVIRVRNNEA